MDRVDLLTTLIELILARRTEHPLRVGIDGVDAAGKTMLADELATVLEAMGRVVIRASIDGFHNPRSVRYRRGRESAEGYYRDSFNHTALQERLLLPLGPGGSRLYRRAAFDHRRNRKVDAPWEVAPPDAVLLFDGVFLQRPELAASWDLVIFVAADFAATRKRVLVRDLPYLGSVERVEALYQTRYIPGQELYFRECQPYRRADVVVVNDDPRQPELILPGNRRENG